MKRKIIRIDEEKCTGCGQCVTACAEGALAIIDGKARLVKDSFCDGLGACIGECPEDALHIEERDAEEFDELAVKRHLAALAGKASHAPAAHPPRPAAPAHFGGCPGSALREFGPSQAQRPADSAPQADTPSALGHWPVQIRLVPPFAPFLKGRRLLVCADCVPFALPDFHSRYLAGRAVLVGCPKLDDLDEIRERLAGVFSQAQPQDVTILRMEVPCCGGIAMAALEARDEAGAQVPVEIHTIGLRGEVRRVERIEPGQRARAFA